MSVILYINGQQVDLLSNSVLAQTKQVNDLNSLDDRQANYTNSFKVPKTAKNIRIFQFLSLPGNNSNLPYQKNECSLYSDSGECFVYKGWAVVSNSDEFYNVNIYDGIIDLYRNIENKNLSELGLSGISHTKEVSTVIASWQSDLNYRYILADYNGNTGDTATGQVNIDYLVPSVKVSYLWNKIFEEYGAGGLGVGYSGSVFHTQNFKNLYMTYPKGFGSTGENDVDIFHSDDWSFPASSNSKYYAKFNTASLNNLAGNVGGIHLQVDQTAVYKLVVRGQLFGRVNTAVRDAWLRALKNCEGLSTGQVQLSNNLYNTSGNRAMPDEAENIPHGTEFEFISTPFELQQNESISFFVTLAEDAPNTQAFVLYQEDANRLEVDLIRIDATQVDFGTALADFSIKDFLSEVVHRFGLTMFKDKYSNVYEFLTLQELLQTSEVEDWSSKFNRQKNEKYLYNSYAQRNWFRYNYNDKEENHKDGYIGIENPNIPDSRTVIQSKIYAPEKYASIYLNTETNVYKLWDKEVVDNPGPNEDPVKYKQLDKRYYFLRAVATSGSINVYSEELAEEIPVTNYYKESHYKLSFQDIVNEYYGPLQQIIGRVVIMDIELFLKETDIVNFDFRKLYYIEQLSSYFLMNKINNYVPGKVTKCEMIQVRYAPLQQAGTSHISVVNVQQNNGAFGQEFIIFTWSVDYPAGEIRIQYSTLGGEDWIDITGPSTSPKIVYINTLPAGQYEFRIADVTNDIYSVIIPITVI